MSPGAMERNDDGGGEDEARRDDGGSDDEAGRDDTNRRGAGAVGSSLFPAAVRAASSSCLSLAALDTERSIRLRIDDADCHYDSTRSTRRFADAELEEVEDVQQDTLTGDDESEKLILTVGNTLLDDEENDMCTTLRMNRKFMQFMRTHYTTTSRSDNTNKHSSPRIKTNPRTLDFFTFSFHFTNVSGS